MARNKKSNGSKRRKYCGLTAEFVNEFYRRIYVAYSRRRKY